MSEFAVSLFWQYVKPGDLRTCDRCGVTRPRGSLLSTTHSDVCKDPKLCAQLKASRLQLAKEAPR